MPLTAPLNETWPRSSVCLPVRPLVLYQITVVLLICLSPSESCHQLCIYEPHSEGVFLCGFGCSTDVAMGKESQHRHTLRNTSELPPFVGMMTTKIEPLRCVFGFPSRGSTADIEDTI